MKIIIDFKNLKEPDSVAYTNGLTPIKPSVEEIEWFDDFCNPNIKSIHLEIEEKDESWSLFRSEKLFQVISWYSRTYFSNSKNISIEIKLE